MTKDSYRLAVGNTDVESEEQEASRVMMLSATEFSWTQGDDGSGNNLCRRERAREDHSRGHQ